MEARIIKEAFMYYIVRIEESSISGTWTSSYKLRGTYMFKFRAKLAAKSYLKRGGYKYPKEVGRVRL